MNRTGIDLGGTKIELIVLSPQGETVYQQRLPTPRGDYVKTLHTIAELVNQARACSAGGTTVGIATPGSLSTKTGKMKNCNSTWLNGTPLQHDLEILLDCPVCLANDADCFALSEATDGAGVHAQTVFGVILGTGCGGGWVVNGKLIQGPNGVSGEWGHNPLPWSTDDERPGADCYCGKKGCIETFLSGPGLSLDHQQHGGESLSAKQIAEQADRGRQPCITTIGRYADRLARSLAHVINFIDPDVIVLGGGLSRIQALYRLVPRIWSKYVFSDQVLTRLLPPRYGDASGVRGAAWLC